jgi:hypothetical protein
MPLIHIKAGNLSKDQKLRIGERIIDAFYREGVPPSSVIVLYGEEDADILMEGGLLFERSSSRGEAAPTQASLPPPAPITEAPRAEQAAAQVADEEEAPPDFRTKLRRSRSELSALKAGLVKALQAQGALSSFQAQEALDLKACDWAPATLRRFFSELEEEGVIEKQGQKRGTRYVWKGIATQPGRTAGVTRLVKRSEDEPEEE